MVRFVGFFGLLFYRSASVLSQILPVGVSYALADVIAEIQFLLRRGPRSALVANLRVVTAGTLTAHEVLQLARKIFRNFGRSVVDFLRLPSLDESALTRTVSAEGLETLEGALEGGGGAVLLTCHIGGWEVGGAFLATLGYRVNAVVRRHPATQVDRFFRRRREERGIRVLGTSESRKTFVDALRRGECVALLGDWDAQGRGKWATFFGRRTRVPSAYVDLATRTGGTILPGVVLRNSSGGYRVRLAEPIRPVPGDAERALEGCLRILERQIRENLTQWFAFNPIWPEQAASGRKRA